MHWGALKTIDGYQNDEVASAFQKAIRRGDEEEALYWAAQLDRSGNGNYAFKRLRIIASEDVGPADNPTVLLIRALYENWLEQRKLQRNRDDLCTSVFLTHAVIALCRCPKSRMVDHALMVFYEEPLEHREIPDYALDRHTDRGRRMGRGVGHFLSTGTELVGDAGLDDPYRERALARDVRTELPRKE